MKGIKNTLEGLEFNYQRRSGNSTKQIDLAIDLLYKGYKVEIRDHWECGHHREANKNLFYRALKRLDSEHNLRHLIEGGKIKIDKNKLTIEFL